MPTHRITTIDARLPEHVPMALARLHRSLAPDGVVELAFRPRGPWQEAPKVDDLFEGAGFATLAAATPTTGPSALAAPASHRLLRRRSLPDTVGPTMGVLVCGLNPSLHAADAGVGFAGPGNRFWPTALEAGLLTVDRDPWSALTVDGVGMTDLVKRATSRAHEVSRDEFARGLARIERLVAWLRPTVVCVVGLAGWRVGHARAQPGVQPGSLGTSLVYVMPSTSGLNARVSRGDLAQHLRAVVALAGHRGTR